MTTIADKEAFYWRLLNDDSLTWRDDQTYEEVSTMNLDERHRDEFRKIIGDHQMSKAIVKFKMPSGATLSDLKDFCLNPKTRALHDQTIIDCGYLKDVKTEKNTKAIFQYHAGKFGVGNRLFLYLESDIECGDNEMAILTTALESTAKKESLQQIKSNNWTEAEMILAGFHIVVDENMNCSLTYIQCVDTCLRLVPFMVVNKLLRSQLTNKRYFPKAFKKHVRDNR